MRHVLAQFTSTAVFPIAVFLTLWAVTAIWIRHETVKASFQVNQKRSQLKILEEEVIKHQSTIERLKSPARLEKLAKGTFHLGPPQKDQIIRVPDIGE